MISKLLVRFLLLISPSLFAQNADSIKHVASSQKDSIQVDSYIQLARYYFQANRNIDSMLKYAKMAMLSAEKNSSATRKIKAYKAVGLAYTEALNAPNAQRAYDAAMLVAVKEKNTEEIIAINNKLGYLYGKLNQLDKAAYYYLNTAKEYETLKDYGNLALTYKNVIVIFTMQYQADKILFYTNKTLELLPLLDANKEVDIVVDVYSNAAMHYFLVGEKEKNNTYINNAVKYANSCLDEASKNNITDGIADAYYVLAHNFRIHKDFITAIKYFNFAKKNQSSLPPRSVFNTYLSLSQTYFEQGNFKSASAYLDTCKALPISAELDCPLLVAELDYHIAKAKGNFSAALSALETLGKLKEEQLNTDRNKVINELELKYQTELKEAKISQLKQESEINKLQIRSLIAFTGIAVLIIIVIIFLFRQSTVKNKLHTVEIEQRLNRARINPHFFFNALASLQNLSLTNAKRELVPGYISKFSKIMRQSLESTFEELTTIENELVFLQDYMQLQQLRSASKFNYEFRLDENIAPNELLIPGMILQPFVENAIEHGFKSIDYEGLVSIDFKIVKNNLQIVVSDNGQGISNSAGTKDYPSRAIQIIKDRLFLLNKQHKSNATFSISTNEAGQGAAVTLFLPLLNK